MPTLSHSVPAWDTVLTSEKPQERKQTFLPTFGWGFLTRIKAAQRLNGHFMSLGVHLSTYCQLDVGSFTTTTQINLKLSFRCYLFPKCHFHREVLLQAAEMPFSSLLPCFSLPTIYLNNYYLSGIGLLVVGNCTINFKGQFLGLDT